VFTAATKEYGKEREVKSERSEKAKGKEKREKSSADVVKGGLSPPCWS
jgi:hypothetical protein